MSLRAVLQRLCLGWCCSAAAMAATCDRALSTSLQEQAKKSVANRDHSAAIQQLRSAVAACPDEPALLLELANTLLMAGKLTEARAEVSRITAANPAAPEALKLQANIDYLLGHFDAARQALTGVLDRDPKDEAAAYMLGRMYYQEGFIDHAIGQFQRVLKINPSAYKAWDNLGLCYQARGDTDRALRHFLTAIKLVETNHPDYDWPYANLSDLLFKTGDAEQAFAAAAKAAKRNPSSARNFYLGGKALEKLGKTELCLNWLERSAALDPSYAEPFYLLARVYSRMGENAKASQARLRFEELKAKAPDRRR